MTADELERETHALIEEIANKAPGNRHHHLGRLHQVMGAYTRAGRAAPATLRRLLDELTTEAVESRFENVPV
ncbi:hypothetical protein OB2597_05755 [Pseudooceanicola batsensis HTCC2597]|uniref:Uncharacterized protein n=1 Tax=Pseudooceanicola batsensis (strain ATCC BAA-863 / DSM 15984 / KCTC 12145 / HTCC2597) TaxID=252305 RepID=A3TSY6_PSEBH|nr:hypothetical protein [Pseudooceanicola batsensis]EAQ04763.1 hypothetical protein OB2597_05755 [Pseudooceanicola batsensis HTCC2597]